MDTGLVEASQVSIVKPCFVQVIVEHVLAFANTGTAFPESLFLPRPPP